MGDYDAQTAFLGTWGRFQQGIFFMLCASILPNGLSSLSVIFLADSPPHHCLIPEGVNLTEEWRQASIPTKLVNGETEYDQCRRYRLDLISNFSAQGLYPGKDVNLSQVPLEGCSDGWSYSKEIYLSTIVTEFDLVCDEDWKQPFTTSVYFFGVLSGSFFSGQLSDRFGRKPVLFATIAVQTIFSVIQAFSPSWEVFAVLFFIVGLGQISNYVAAFVLGTEILTGPPRMLFASMGICGFFTIGYMMLPLFAYFCQGWRTLLVAMSLPSVIYFVLWWLVPESPRWLLSQGRLEEAEAILRRAARTNKVTAPEVIFHPIQGEQTRLKSEKFHGFLDLLKTSNIRHITLILTFTWFALNVGYYGLSLNTSNLHGDPYLNCFISAAIEIPAYIISWLFLRYLPRRPTFFFCMLVGGILLFFIQLVPPGLQALAISMEMIGKLCVTAGWTIILGYTGELYPTILRNTGLGISSMTARFGSAVSPYFLYLGFDRLPLETDYAGYAVAVQVPGIGQGAQTRLFMTFSPGSYSKYLPYILLGSMTIAAAVSVLFLPETFGLPLPESVAEMPKRERMKWCCLSSEQINQQKGKTCAKKILAESYM